MAWTIDHIIFFSFLILNVILGLKSSKGITSITQYAIGDRNFSTAVLVSTLVATWISGSFFANILIETYKTGLYYFIPVLFEVVCFFIVGYFFIPRMSEFLGKLSIAEAMNDIYGQKVRIVTSISGFIFVSGLIAVQLKIAGSVFEYILNINSLYGIILSGLIITLYSTLGGIKSVTFTDVIQFFTFATILPVIVYYFFFGVDGITIVFSLAKHPNFNFSDIFIFSNDKIWKLISLSIYMVIPAFNPAIFQRIAMSKNLKQAQDSFYILSFIVFVLILLVGWLSVLLMFRENFTGSANIIHSLFDITPPIYKGLLLIGIVAMVMSTIDSYINSSSVLITHDFINVFTKLKNELLTARIVSFLLGISGILLSLKDIGIFRLAVLTASFYMCIVTVPFIMAVIGYRTPYEKAVLWGMAGGFLVNSLWMLLDITIIDGVIPAMLVNWLVLVIMHKYYYSKEKINITN